MTDFDKKFDFMVLSKKSFLESYSYLTENDYEALVRQFSLEVLADEIAEKAERSVNEVVLASELEKLRVERKLSIVQLKDYLSSNESVTQKLISKALFSTSESVNVSWNFEVDVSDLDSEYVDIEGFARECAKNELEYLVKENKLSEDDFTVG